MMKRPVMNPMYMDDDHAKAGVRISWRRCLKVVRRIGKVLFYDVLRRKEKLRVEVGTPLSRFMRGFLYRLMFVPTLLAVLVCVLVVTATHPKLAPGVMDPVSQGVYYDPVELLSLDGTKLEGWLVPLVDARRVLAEKEGVLHRKQPAIVLVHDFGASRQQMLPLVAPLHEAGFVVLAINLRGHGPSANIGSTFGLNEANDVRAAVEMLRRRSFVDPEAIAVLGVGTGATAALLAAGQDARIRALVLDHPVRQFQDLLDERIGPKQGWLSWLRPLCKWTFEIAYKVDAEDLNLSHFSELMKRVPVLMLDDTGESMSCFQPIKTRQIVEFLKKHVVPHIRTATTLLQKETVTQARPIQETPDAGGNLGGNDSWPPQSPASQMLERVKQTGW
jgi:pimeloyl-ACP methyl ester carboxylesterase